MTLIWKQVSDDFDDRRFSVCTVFLSRSGQMPSVQLCCDWCLHHALSGFLCWRLQRCWLCYALFQLACMSAASKGYLSIPLDFLLILCFFWFKIMCFFWFLIMWFLPYALCPSEIFCPAYAVLMTCFHRSFSCLVFLP